MESAVALKVLSYNIGTNKKQFHIVLPECSNSHVGSVKTDMKCESD